MDATLKLRNNDRLEWLYAIIKTRQSVCSGTIDKLRVVIDGNLQKCDMHPEHITSLACLIECCSRHKCPVQVNASDEIRKFLEAELDLTKYWNQNESYVASSNTDILNLWKIKEDEMDAHALRVGDYFRSTRFKHKDLSPISGSLTEAYYNVIDHSNCEGNAFSFVEYDRNEERINVAVCDFGRGIPNSVRTVLPELNDADAIRKALEPTFTINSTHHNAGLGLSNLRGYCTSDDDLWIISNGVALVVGADSERVVPLKEIFYGTLLLYSISLAHLYDEEIDEATIMDLNF